MGESLLGVVRETWLRGERITDARRGKWLARGES